jgi:hypothetical protein
MFSCHQITEPVKDMTLISLKSAISQLQEQKLHIPISAALAVIIGTWVLFRLGVVIYRLYIHPLSNFPGPRLAAATSLYEMYFDVSVLDHHDAL